MGQDFLDIHELTNEPITVCPRIHGRFYKKTYYKKMVKTPCTYAVGSSISPYKLTLKFLSHISCDIRTGLFLDLNTVLSLVNYQMFPNPDF